MDSIFKQVTLRICGSLQIHEALYDVYNYLKHVLPLNGMVITVYEDGDNASRVIAGAGEEGGRLVDQHFSLSPEVLGSVHSWQQESKQQGRSWLRDQDHPINIEIYRLFSKILPQTFLPDVSCFSTITCPLMIKKQIIGNITLVAFCPNRYTESHADILMEVNEPFAIALANALSFMALEKHNRLLKQEVGSQDKSLMIGAASGLKRVKQMVDQVAPTMSHVMLMGETGTGKEVVAHQIHQLSSRADGPMITLNCGAIPDSLIDSELFGHEKGAFTGAYKAKQGRFERANNGTLFLDEIGELPLAAQTKLLRVIQTGEFERVGGSRTLKCDVRLICATHRDLAQRVQEQSFREDLWYRLNVFPIVIPPLRERKQDIPAMVEHFMRMKSQEMNLTSPPALAEDAMARLLEYAWPGNVRELQNLIERGLILSRGGPLQFPDIQCPLHQASTPAAAPQVFPSLDDAIRQHIQRALVESKGKISGENGAASLLAINPNTLWSRMRKLGIYRKSEFQL